MNPSTMIKNDDLHTFISCVTRLFYDLLMIPQWIADGVTDALRDATIVTRAREK